MSTSPKRQQRREILRKGPQEALATCANLAQQTTGLASMILHNVVRYLNGAESYAEIRKHLSPASAKFFELLMGVCGTCQRGGVLVKPDIDMGWQLDFHNNQSGRLCDGSATYPEIIFYEG